MGEWSNLTQREKSNIIRFAIKNGVSDINQIRDTFNVYISGNGGENEYKEGGSIHIKHPGRLTALKERTGKTEAELWATGNAHTRKMITFARNARKWRHADGGYLVGKKYTGMEMVDNGTNNNRPQDQPQISWIESWLNSRKDVMAKNIADTEFGNQVIVYSPKNNTGDVRDAGFNADYDYPIYNPLYWFLGHNPRIKQAEKIINREVQNIKNVPVTNVGNDYKPSYGMLGSYVKPSHWDNSGNYIAFLGTPKDEVKIHEFTHASNPRPQENYIEQVLYKNENIPNSIPGKDKLTQAKELYAALQEVRYKSGLKPNVVVDEQWLKNNKKYFENTYLEGLPNNILIRLFNELAQNNSSYKKSDNSYLAALGGNLKSWKHDDGGSLSGFSEYELERLNEERRDIENQKQWLQNWYAKRLPAIGKEHLQEYVDAGLGVPYKTTVETARMYSTTPNLLGEYTFANSDYRSPSMIKESGYDPSTRVELYRYLQKDWLGNEHYRPATPVHEFTHATQYGGSSRFNPAFTGGKSIGEFDDYLQRPDEQHSRIMELRYENNLDPTKTNYTIEDIKAFKDQDNILEELRRGGMTDEDIVNALNTWASNTESAFDLGNDKHISSTGGPLYPFSFGPLPAVRYAEGGKKTEGSVWHKEANGLYLDTDANNRTYNDALDYFTQLGFKGKNASDLALQYAADNMQYDAGILPEITITPNVQKRIIIDNGTKNVHYAPHIVPVQESTESKIAAGMIGIPLIATQTAPVLGAAMSKAIAARDAFRLAHPYVSALNDITWTNLGLHDLATDNGIAKTKRLIDEGKKGRALLSGLGDAANALGAFELFRVGSKIANPIYRSAWAYNTIPNWGYKKHLERANNWVSGLLSGTSPNINNEAEWLTTELRKDLIENGTDQFGYLSALFAKNKNAGIEIAARGRDDASRLYNGLPLRHNYYIQNADGSYSYNLAKIEDDWKKLSGEDYFPLRYDDFYPESLATSGHHGKDVITGGGGNLTGNAFIGRVTVGNFPNKEEFAVKLIEDIQDAHPFRRNKNTFSKVLQNIIDKKIQKVQKKADSLYISILNKGQDYGQSKIGKLWYDWIRGEVLNKIRYSGQFRLPGTYYDKSTNDIAVNDFWKTVNAKMRNFELGTLTGAKPFLMRTEVPTTFKYKPTTLNRGRDAKSLEDALNSIVLEPTLILGHHSDKYVIPVVVNSSSRFNIDYSNHINPNFSFNDYLKSTGGSLYLYPFSFKKNPYWKTPVVRYKNGGKVNRDSEFLQSETIKNVKKWLNKGTKFQTPRPRTVFTQNIVNALDPKGPDIQYVWDDQEHTSYSAFKRNPDYRAPAIPTINNDTSTIGLNVSKYIEKTPGIHLSPEYILNNLPNFKIPPVSIPLPKRNNKNLNRNWIQQESMWNPAYGYETFHLENSTPARYGIKYYSIPGAVNAGQGSSAVLDSTAMGIPIEELNERIFDYRTQNGGWSSFNSPN